MGEIHELFVLALFLVWFAGATPDFSVVSMFVLPLVVSGLHPKTVRIAVLAMSRCRPDVDSFQSLRAACLQNETAPEKLLNRYEKQFAKNEKRSEKRSETRLKKF